MKIKLKNPKISTSLVVLSIVIIVMLGPQLLSQNTFAQQTGANSTVRAAGVTPKLNATKSVSIPVSRGYVNGKIGYFIATDASDPQIAASITNTTGFKVNFSPILALSPESSRQQGYDFINGVKQSSSPMGFQLGVSSVSPGEKGYSPLYALNFVKWNANVTPRILKSASEVLSAERNGELTISKTGIVINSPEVTPGK
jgi:hypothetical protein